MRPAIGIDAACVTGWRRRLERTPRVAQLAFTPRELEAAAGDSDALIVNWAVKEAVAKALGTGFDGLGWHGIELRERTPRMLRLRVRSPHPEHATFPTELLGGLRTDPDHVLVAVLDCDLAPRHAAHRLHVCATGSRPEQRRRCAGGARQAAETATRALGAAAGRHFAWSRDTTGAPRLRVAGLGDVAVSLTHARGLAAALVADPSRTRRRPRRAHGRAFDLAIALDLHAAGLI